MDEIAAALGDAKRWRIVELLAERPRSVGELAERTGLRQPQTTKHLQTLARAGLVTVSPLGQRRVYAVEAGPLAAFGERLRELVGAIEAHAGERDVLTRYQAAIEAETAAASRRQWADGRTFTFDRLLPAPPDVAWRHWADPDLLASWWVPPSMRVTECALEPAAGGRVVLAYRDAEGLYRSEGRVRTAEEPGHLAFELSVLDAAGAVFFTGHYDVTLTAAPGGTRLRLDLRITDTTVESAPFVAGIETGWGQVLDHLTAALTRGKGTPS
ncbi:metalloregulator ArsR/SmtB family transcription factor [Amycolatopsis sp., V23-08]|uniref:Metalloregulator ArsR/SmtB family transcription factor n=1 Tax=Amycolatopsis heterodermiae TaxID=3110235 RepID=A0ABU5R375_9PSEU|nr:metalloregulator ArsR/SmtB family transcription factor [Amycolatopsis sp., V23-08]MEA5360671.1 metalloregulator ArsR/SmtB family transcription factor [Amycolatopsis sp., V23-08]